jgi:EAL domain-containing protein (putative c-di-GMP-specific phosphodiesterase class I)/ActR/RegA family two-component response regulator
VLVVDDEVLLCRGFARELGRAGFAVETATDGIGAKELLRAGSFDAVVSDISMPGMSGIQLLQAVHSLDEDLPVVLMTAGPSVQTAVQALEHGALRYLIKPFDFLELKSAVEYAVRLRKLAGVRRQALALLDERKPPIAPSLEQSFERALAQLWMAYQPIVCAHGRRVHGYEALLRSAEPALPHPGVLIEAAEQLGRVQDLGRAVRASVAASLAAAPSGVDIFINLHAGDLTDDSLYAPSSPLSALAERVVLEITERASLDNIKDVRSRIAALRAMGFRIAVDDLGAGYAGLTSFVQLEPDVVKLDMSLVRGVHEQPTRRKLIASLSQLCKDLGMLVVAEGIEVAEERDMVVELGCDLLQGYLICRPGQPFPSVSW